MFKYLIIISALFFSCNSRIDLNYDFEKAVFEDTYKELFPWLEELPDSNYINPQALTVQDSLQYPWLYRQSKIWMSYDSSLKQIKFGVIMLDSVFNTNFFFKETPYLSDFSIYPDSLMSDSIWTSLVRDFSSKKHESIDLDTFNFDYLGNLKVIKESDHSKNRKITTNYAIPIRYLRFSRVSFSENKSKAVFYAEDYYTYGGLVFAELRNGNWQVIHYEINWVA